MAAGIGRCSFLLLTVCFALATAIPVPEAALTKVYIVKAGGLPYIAARRQRNGRSTSTGTFLSPESYGTSARKQHVAILTSTGGRIDDLLYSYSYVFSGFSAILTDAQAEAMRGHPDVSSVRPDVAHRIQSDPGGSPFTDGTGPASRRLLTSYTPHFLGLDGKNGLYKNTTGKGVIVGMLDSGIWPEAPSFNPKGMFRPPAHWKGMCTTGDAWNASTCNNKIIGARYYFRGFQAYTNVTIKGNKLGIYASARDEGGHGSHTSSTAAGSVVKNVTIIGSPYGSMHGIAYNAHIAVYKVCFGDGFKQRFPGDGECLDSDILMAFEDASRDGVDVISFSIGGAPDFLDAIDEGSLHASNAGILVVASGGNNPGLQTVSNNAPWYVTVAASTVNREYKNSVALGSKETFEGTSLTAGTNPAGVQLPLVWAGNISLSKVNATNASLCVAGSLDPAKAKGKIVVCLRGVTARLEKGSVVKSAGGVGFILANDITNGKSLVADFHLLPAIHVSYLDGAKIKKYIASSRAPTASISGKQTIFSGEAPVMANFSSEGPNYLVIFAKPDITAPGVNILGAWSEATGVTGFPGDARKSSFNIISGTSMATPHVAGTALLLKALHPAWSPGMIQSALITSAYTKNNLGLPIKDSAGLPATMLNYGGGHINPQAAANPGLVYDQTIVDYLNLLCNYLPNDGSSSTLLYCSDTGIVPPFMDYNYPSISLILDGTSGPGFKVHRRVTLVGPPATYTATVVQPYGVEVVVEPKTIKFGQTGQVEEFDVIFYAKKATTRFAATAGFTFGSYTWTDGVHKVVSPIQVNVTATLP